MAGPGFFLPLFTHNRIQQQRRDERQKVNGNPPTVFPPPKKKLTPTQLSHPCLPMTAVCLGVEQIRAVVELLHSVSVPIYPVLSIASCVYQERLLNRVAGLTKSSKSIPVGACGQWSAHLSPLFILSTSFRGSVPCRWAGCRRVGWAL